MLNSRHYVIYDYGWPYVECFHHERSESCHLHIICQLLIITIKNKYVKIIIIIIIKNSCPLVSQMQIGPTKKQVHHGWNGLVLSKQLTLLYTIKTVRMTGLPAFSSFWFCLLLCVFMFILMFLYVILMCKMKNKYFIWFDYWIYFSISLFQF